jgi:hypothetical protein
MLLAVLRRVALLPMFLENRVSVSRDEVTEYSVNFFSSLFNSSLFSFPLSPLIFFSLLLSFVFCVLISFYNSLKTIL